MYFTNMHLTVCISLCAFHYVHFTFVHFMLKIWNLKMKRHFLYFIRQMFFKGGNDILLNFLSHQIILDFLWKSMKRPIYFIMCRNIVNYNNKRKCLSINFQLLSIGLKLRNLSYGTPKEETNKLYFPFRYLREVL